MKATELMIGDWVQKLEVGGHYRKCRINAIFDDGIVDCVTSDGEVHTLSVNGIEPIPLTGEILEKNGFTIHLSHCGIKWLWIEKQKFELAIDEENGNKITTALGLIDIEIKYVHKLQYALKLCGIEKQIEL